MKVSGYSKNAILLAQRIKKEIGVDVEPIINRTRAGHWQRSAGAWKWLMMIKGQGASVGSGDRAIDCLKSEKWEISYHFSDICIDIETPIKSNYYNK